LRYTGPRRDKREIRTDTITAKQRKCETTQTDFTWITNSGFVVLAAAFAALAGEPFGYDTAAIFGAVIFVKKEFALAPFQPEFRGQFPQLTMLVSNMRVHVEREF
jgi:hypothetical protein